MIDQRESCGFFGEQPLFWPTRDFIGISRAVFLFILIWVRFLDTYAPKYHNFRCLMVLGVLFRAPPD